VLTIPGALPYHILRSVKVLPMGSLNSEGEPIHCQGGAAAFCSRFLPSRPSFRSLPDLTSCPRIFSFLTDGIPSENHQVGEPT
jgi:hypothetical protein